MPINNAEGIYFSREGGTVEIHIYYDTTFTPVGPTQPLVNGPRGFCLDVKNTSGHNVSLTVSNGASVLVSNVTVAQGDPVTTGQGASRTAAQLAAAGYTTRGDVQSISFG